MNKTLLTTGTAGFIGSTFVRLAQAQGYKVLILDSMTYAGHMENINETLGANAVFIKGDILDGQLVSQLLNEHKPCAVVNFAAESHVDNSIAGPKPFMETNIMGVFQLLESARAYWKGLPQADQTNFRFLHVSTDEVYGSLGDTGKFTEETAYQPNSPYSASKASADLLVRAWHHTYGLPTLTTNCSNNYGPRQFPEKLIPRMIQRCLSEGELPVYGNGKNIRDWIHVEDHCSGILLALQKGTPGETYCFGGNSERNNLDVVHRLCEALDKTQPRKNGESYSKLIKFVEDRAGHDFRYAIDDSKAQKQLGFTRKYKNFEEGLHATLNWYLNNQTWVNQVLAKGKTTTTP